MCNCFFMSKPKFNVIGITQNSCVFTVYRFEMMVYDSNSQRFWFGTLGLLFISFMKNIHIWQMIIILPLPFPHSPIAVLVLMTETKSSPS